MSYDTASVEFVGFNPSDELRALSRQLTDMIEYEAPNGSFVRLTLNQGSQTIKGVFTVISRAGTFLAEAAGDSPHKVMQGLSETMMDQLRSWKMARIFKKIVS